MRGLYAIVDVGTLSKRQIDPVGFARAVLDAKPAAMQLRAKDALARETLRPVAGAAGEQRLLDGRLAADRGCPRTREDQLEVIDGDVVERHTARAATLDRQPLRR